LCRDQGNPAYAEYLVARADNCDDQDIRALADALQCDAVRQFITTTYDGQVVPAF
jgi:D-methionine transport system substrate-binding protein